MAKQLLTRVQFSDLPFFCLRFHLEKPANKAKQAAGATSEGFYDASLWRMIYEPCGIVRKVQNYSSMDAKVVNYRQCDIA